MNVCKHAPTLGLFFLLVAVSSPAVAQQAERGVLLDMYAMQVKPGHSQAFRAGIESWKNCYLEHEGSEVWTVWQRLHGEGTHYVAVFPAAGWAAVDADDAAGRACESIVFDQVIANTSAVERSFAIGWPEVSLTAASAQPVVRVSYWQVHDGRAFERAVVEISSAMREIEDQARGHWFRVTGGSASAPHYFVSVPYASMAELDEIRPGVFELVTEARGAEEAERLRTAFLASVATSWSYLYRRDDPLSHTP